MQEMKTNYSEQYLEYLTKHIGAVQQAYRLLIKHNIITIDSLTANTINNHDKSKYDKEEWSAYVNKFYNKAEHKEEEFKLAWLHHQHHNPHHPQYWCLQTDGKPGELECLDMPENYIVEMICDWWSFSIINNDMHKIQEWYKNKGSKYLMSPKTKKRVEHIMDSISELKF